MAITNVGKNRVYASIKDLPENQKLVDGDRIIIDTEEGTCLVDYSNIKIDLNHTTFGDQFSEMVNYTGTVTAFITQMESEFSSVQEETANLKAKMDDMENMMDAVKLMIKFIMGTAAGKYEEYPMEQANANLKGQGLALFNECMAAMESKTFTFSRYNLYNGRVGSGS